MGGVILENRYKLIIDLKSKMITNNTLFKQGNTGTSVLEITLVDEGLPVNITGQTVQFNFLRSDSAVVTQDSTTGVTILDALTGKFECVLKAATLAVDGKVEAEIVFTEGTDVLSSTTFVFYVDASIGLLSIKYISSIVSALEEWQTTFDLDEANRANVFTTSQSSRSTTFNASEASRSSVFNAAEELREIGEDSRITAEDIRVSTFNVNEAARANTFSTSQNDRTATFNASEASRSSVFNAAEELRDVSEDLREERFEVIQTAVDNVASTLSLGRDAIMTSTYISVGNESFVPINLPSYNPDSDYFDIIYNGDFLTKDMEYSENENGLGVDLLGWTLDIDDTVVFRVHKAIVDSASGAIAGSQIQAGGVTDVELSNVSGNIKERFETYQAESATKAELAVTATTTVLGRVKVDGSSIVADVNGVLSSIGNAGGGVITAWAVGTTYAATDIISYGGKMWASQVSGNIGKTPGSNTLYWQEYFSSAFTVRNSINLYDSSLIQTGVIARYDTGIYAALDYAIMSGKMPVSPGNTYVISKPSIMGDSDNLLGVISCFGASSNYIGLDRVVAGYPVAYGITYVEKVVNERIQTVVTIASDSLIRFIDVRLKSNTFALTQPLIDAYKNSVQFQAGTDFTVYEAYGSAYQTLKDIFQSPSLAVAQTDIVSLKSSIANSLSFSTKVIKSGDFLYVRTTWDVANDLVQKMELRSSGDYTKNKLIEFDSIGLIPIATTDINVPTTTMTLLKNATDDICPANYNGTYIGANHGPNYIRSIACTAHGKTVQDVGSEWVDATATKWYIMRIVDVDNIWVMSENIAVDGTWLFDTAISGGSTLTHSLGATHTGTITFTVQTLTMLYPSIKNETRKILINGKTELIAEGVYSCDYLQVVDAYDISSVSGILAYVRSLVGGSTQPAFDNASIANDARMTITYTFQNNGACVVNHSLRTYNKVKLTYVGFIQSISNVMPSGGNLFEYIPKTIPFVVGSNTYDFESIKDITNIPDSVEVTKATWSIADNPPDRFIQFSKTSEGLKNSNFGFTVGYCPEIGIGKPSVRKDLIDSAFYMYTTKKQYPKGISLNSIKYPDNLIPANTNFDMVAFRCPINYGLDTDATNISWYKVSNDIYLMLDYHVNIDKVLSLPVSMLNKKITVVEKTDSFVLSSDYVSYDGIKIAVTGGYGYAVLKLN